MHYKIILIYLIVMIKENFVENIFNPLVSVLVMEHKLHDMQTSCLHKAYCYKHMYKYSCFYGIPCA